MTELENNEQWCESCGVRMQRNGTKMDILSQIEKSIVTCKMCRKWTWEELI